MNLQRGKSKSSYYVMDFYTMAKRHDTEQNQTRTESSSPLLWDMELQEWDKNLLSFEEPLPEFDSSLLEWDGSVPDKWEPLPEKWEPLKEWKEQSFNFTPVEWGDFNSKQNGNKPNKI